MLEPARQHRVDLGAVDIDAKDVVELDEHAAWLHVRLRRPRLELMPQRVVPAEIAQIHPDSVASAFRRKINHHSADDRTRTSITALRACKPQNRRKGTPPGG